MTPATERAILLTGATGYVGGRLLERLEASGRDVRCLARRPDVLGARIGARTRVIRGDVLDRASLAGALQGVHTACCLVHSMVVAVTSDGSTAARPRTSRTWPRRRASRRSSTSAASDAGATCRRTSPAATRWGGCCARAACPPQSCAHRSS